jgi:hypothetical protein
MVAKVQGGVLMRRFISFCFVTVALFAVLQYTAYAGSIKWNKILDIGVNNLNSVTQNETGLLVAVGEDGVIKTSLDGVTWKGEVSGTTECLNDIVWANDMFVAVGEGVILTSSDGAVWRVNSSVPLNSVAWTGSIYVAVGKFGSICTSDDGSNWEINSIDSNETLNDVYFTGSRLIAVGDRGGVYTSIDGLEWSMDNVNSNVVLKSVSWNENRFVILTEKGAILTSSDCENWEWVLKGTKGVNTFGNTSKGALYLGTGIEDLIWDGEKFVAVGLKGGIFTSQDGINWAQKSSNTDNNLKSIVKTGIQYVIVGQNCTVLTSANTEKWALKSSSRYGSLNSSSSGNIPGFKSVVWGKDKFVVVGDQGLILTSPDGDMWTQANYNGNADLKKVIWNGQKFIAVGSMGTVLFSNDGVKWTKANTGIFSSLNSIAWNGKIYVAVGETGQILTSGDGSRWSALNSGAYRTISKIIWDKNRFIAVEDKNEALLTSVDGIKWTRIQYIKDGFINSDPKEVILIPDAENLKGKVKGTENFKQIVWNGTEYIAVGSLTDSNIEISGEDNLHMGNSVMTSPDGVTWSKVELGTCRDINSIAWDGERFVMVGDYRTILYSIPAYIKVLINDEELTSEIPPIVRNNRTLVPLRAIFEALGLTVGWDGATKTITGEKDGVKITLTVNSKDAVVNDIPVKLDSPATIVNRRTMVPVRFIAESLGADVKWDQSTKTVLIKS